MQQQTIGRQSVAPRATGLLIVGFDAARQIIVDDEAQIGLVDSHTESIRRNDNRNFTRHECLLNRSALVAGQAGMVEGQLAAHTIVQQLDDMLTIFSGRRVNDSASLVLLQELDQPIIARGIAGG